MVVKMSTSRVDGGGITSERGGGGRMSRKGSRCTIPSAKVVGVVDGWHAPASVVISVS